MLCDPPDLYGGRGMVSEFPHSLIGSNSMSTAVSDGSQSGRTCRPNPFPPSLRSSAGQPHTTSQAAYPTISADSWPPKVRASFRFVQAVPSAHHQTFSTRQQAASGDALKSVATAHVAGHLRSHLFRCIFVTIQEDNASTSAPLALFHQRGSQ